MLSVHCMLNQNGYPRDMLPTCSPMTPTSTQHERSPMLDIASLLCRDNDDDDLDNTSRTTTPSLSAASSPVSTSSSMSFIFPPTNTNNGSQYNNIPFSLTTPSAYSPPLPLPQKSAYHRKNLPNDYDYFTEPVCYAPSTLHHHHQQQQQQQQSSGSYHYEHRLLLFVDDDIDTQGKWRPMERNKVMDGGDMTDEEDDDENNDKRIKTKRRRANNKQLQVLNQVFQHTFFPSTQMRAQLGRQLGMSPRTVQIWFQNRRQALRTKERQRWMA